MKLVCIIIVWDDYDLLELAINNLRPLSDGIIVIWSRVSNFGEISNPPILRGDYFYNFEPDLTLPPSENERAKRNFGLDIARKYGFTHFLVTDSDEYYEHSEFLREKEKFKNPSINGLVCGLKCYFKSPELSVHDNTLVSFIHKLTPQIRFEWNTRYPFAFHGPKKEIRIDPTRQLNITSGVEWSEITMHHASWIRKDPEKKIRNSTARANIEHSTILSDLREAKPGYYCQFYQKNLVPSTDLIEIWAKAKANS